MDPFDDLLPETTVARSRCFAAMILGKLFLSFFFLFNTPCLCQVALLFSFVVRPGTKFAPKAKAKQRPRKEVPSSEHATSSKDAGNECQNVGPSTLSVPAKESMGFIHQTQVQFPNSESGNPDQDSVQGDSAALVDSSTITVSEIGAGQNSTNFLESAFEVNIIFIDSILSVICNLIFFKLFFNFRLAQQILTGTRSLTSFLKPTSIMVSYVFTLIVCVKPLFFISDLYMSV